MEARPGGSAGLRPEDVGARAVTTSALAREHAGLLADTLDRPRPVVALPPLWHWAFFPPQAATAELGPDGHPARRAGGPLADLPRRMWLGGRLSWEGPLAVDREAERRTSVEQVQAKSGRQGRFVLVTLRHEIHQDGKVVVVEEQDLAYRPAGGPPVPPPGGDDLSVRDGEVICAVDPLLLFRYSAVTFNSHRIHYDADYAREVEGYPALVVHGPLVATLLGGRCGDMGLATFAYRSIAPSFAPGRLALGRRDEAGGATLWARRADGVEVMQATATWRTA